MHTQATTVLTQIAAAVKALFTQSSPRTLMAAGALVVTLGGCANVPLDKPQHARIEPLMRTQGAISPAEHLYLQGRTAYGLGDIDRARRSFSAALRLEPDHFDALNGMALVHSSRAEYEQAMALLRSALQRAPDNAMLKRNLERVEQAARTVKPVVVAAAPVPKQPEPARTARGPALVQLAPNVFSLERAPAATVAAVRQEPEVALRREPAAAIVSTPVATTPPAALVAAATVSEVAAPPLSPPPIATPLASKPDARPAESLKLATLPTPSVTLPPVKTVSESPAAWVVRAAHMPTPALAQSHRAVRVMLSNASGSKVLAAYGAKQLRTNGVAGVQENEYHGDTGNQTVIFYREGHRDEAEVVLSMLQLPTSRPITIVATRFIPAGVDVRVVLGGHLRGDRRAI